MQVNTFQPTEARQMFPGLTFLCSGAGLACISWDWRLGTCGKYQIALRRGDLLEISDEIRVRDLLDISDAKGTIINISWD